MDSYTKIIRISNALYNDGLEKAKVRDLSGAIQSLRKSLRYYKGNIHARNLLGLIYYEIGEVADALSEWVLSRSLSPENNLAEEYLEEIQSNHSQLNSVNQTIKKYNQALLYCQQDSKDLAIIQLKKVLSMNPGLIKGYQLLALLYMEEGKYELAKKELRAAVEIDSSNITTLRYLREVNLYLHGDLAPEKAGHKEKKASAYQSGNETIIQPTNFKDYSAVMTVVNLIIGVVIGVLITSFLVIPGVKQKAVSEAKKAELAANDSLTTRNQEVKSLENQIKELNEKIKKQENASEDVKKTVDSYEQLIAAYDAFAQQNIQGAGEAIEKVEAELLGEQAKNVYNNLNGQVNAQYITAVYNQAEQDYNARRFPEAIAGLEKVVEVEEDYNNGYAIYYLAQSYRQTGDLENAKKYYQRMVELHPGTSRANKSQQYLNEMGQQPQP
ncbi:MAG: tetratricopeptide repeat protein [Lachnospiraceae bacterium]|nr:tetratricopeptide repeat protein [Lachnospiraceae bacterium]